MPFSKKTNLILIVLLLQSVYSFSQPISLNSSEIQLAIKKLNRVGSVMYIAAHPDDENTRLLAYLAKERLLRTAYLSITRGDGGQNLVGTEQAEYLGILRTQELLAARRVDGAEQLFTRANDFGYSKNPDETFKIWNKNEILADVVWQIRKFRPDVIIARFPSTGEGGHGHHTASAILAKEAFDAAADSSRFPEQLKYVEVWQTRRLFWNTFNFGSANTTASDQLKIDVGLYNVLLGKSYGEIAAESRSMHKSQGFGSARNRGAQLEYFKLIAGDSVKKDLVEGIDVSWNRIKGGAEINSLLNKVALEYKSERPDKSINLLLQTYKALNKLEENHWKAIKKKEIEQLLLACSGTHIEALATDYSIVPGDSLKISAQIIRRNSASVNIYSINWNGTGDSIFNRIVNNNELLKIDKTIRLSAETAYSQPYWLRKTNSEGLYTVEEQEMRGVPENKAAMTVSFALRINNELIRYNCPVMYKWVDPVDGERYRNMEVAPIVSANLDQRVYVFTNQQPKKVNVALRAGKSGVSGTVRLVLPKNWKSEPESINFEFKKAAEESTLSFMVYPGSAAIEEQEVLRVEINVANQVLSKGLIRIQHDHVPVQTLFPDVKAQLLVFPLEKRGTNIGYLMGAGDEVPACLEQLGYKVTMLNDALILDDNLKSFDAIVIGIRAYNTNERMNAYQPKLMEYVKEGGILVVQYNTNNFISSIKSDIGPYPFKISRDRVTDERSPVNFEDPNNVLLNYPNKITAKDFEGWIQERGIYFAKDIDSNYKAVLSCNDPGDDPMRGSLIIADYGKGRYIYTGLSFFRQLPAGVPGAYRLFSNMLSVGQLR